jgi:cell surface protein SprA
MKLEYAPTEDDIKKKEVGNVSMPLNSSLIRGAQSLFGVKHNCNLENNNYGCFQSKITN